MKRCIPARKPCGQRLSGAVWRTAPVCCGGAVCSNGFRPVQKGIAGRGSKRHPYYTQIVHSP